MNSSSAHDLAAATSGRSVKRWILVALQSKQARAGFGRKEGRDGTEWGVETGRRLGWGRG